MYVENIFYDSITKIPFLLLQLVLSFCCYMSRIILGNQPDVVPLSSP